MSNLIDRMCEAYLDHGEHDERWSEWPEVYRNSVRDSMRAALAALWQPIETAPKDREWIEANKAWETNEGYHADGAFTFWAELMPPVAPEKNQIDPSMASQFFGDQS